jgi:hypothetical protein
MTAKCTRRRCESVLEWETARHPAARPEDGTECENGKRERCTKRRKGKVVYRVHEVEVNKVVDTELLKLKHDAGKV